MKEIVIRCKQDGTIWVNNKNLILSNENESVEVTIDYSGVELGTYTKRADIYVAYDQTYDYVTGTTADELVFNLTNEHLKQGVVRIQPVAYLDGDAEYEDMLKEKWQHYQFKVEYSVNSSESTTYVDDPLGTVLGNEIDALDLRVGLIEGSYITATGGNSNIDELSFDTTPTSSDALLAGQTRWSSAEGTLLLGMNGGDVTQSIGLEQYLRVKNNSGAEIVDGTVVMFNGTDGNSGVINVKKYDTTSDYYKILGVATEPIANGDLGFVTWFGKLQGIQTNGVNYGETWVDGEILFPSLTTQGGFTKTLSNPTLQQVIAFVINSHGSNGQLFIRVK